MTPLQKKTNDFAPAFLLMIIAPLLTEYLRIDLWRHVWIRDNRLSRVYRIPGGRSEL